jgi:hypothetical protein
LVYTGWEYSDYKHFYKCPMRKPTPKKAVRASCTVKSNKKMKSKPVRFSESNYAETVGLLYTNFAT